MPNSTASVQPKRIAFIAFDKITLLDLVGVYDPIARLKSMGYIPDLEWDICAVTEQIKDNFGFTVAVDKVKPDLSQYDTIIVPGGFGTRPLKDDTDFINWIKQAKGAQYKASVCTGALLLGAAGFLEGKRATTNRSAFELLKPYCQEVQREKVMEDGGVITAGGVSSSLDLGLYLCEKWAGKEAREKIQDKMDFQCYPS
ncbi:MAG: DJ-1/PfpI family protein [Saprospiraceae bacterium]|nr:DJ-1/PfpI family protein [Saprospiraceae bacterium]